MNILVTGGHGFVGSHLLDQLETQDNIRILAPSRIELNLCDREAVQKCFQKHDIDQVIHLAASVGGIGANRSRPADFYFENALMGLHLLEASAKANVKRFILLGTICGYPKFAPIPFLEESLFDGYPEETNAPYGVAKRGLWVAAQAYQAQYGLPVVGVFPTNLYGPRDNFDLETSHVIPALIRKIEKAKKEHSPHVTVWGSGEASRDFLYVTDAVAGILLALEASGIEGEMFNFGSGAEHTIRELVETICSILEYEGKIQWDTSKPDGQPRRCVSGEKAEKKLGFKPSVSLQQGLRQTIQWYREQGKD